MKKILLLIVALAMLLSACDTSADRNWKMILSSAEHTVVTIGVTPENAKYNKWLGGKFAEQMQNEFAIQVVVKEISTDRAISKLSADKADGVEKGEYDIVLVNGTGFGEMFDKGLLYGPFADRLQNVTYLDTNHTSYKYRDVHENQGYFVPIGRKMLSLVYSEDIFYDKPKNYAELFKTMESLKGKAVYPDPRYSLEGEAFVLGLVSESVDMEPYLGPERDLDAFRRDVFSALTPLRGLIPHLKSGYPRDIEPMFIDGRSLLGMNMDYVRVGEQIKSYEYPDTAVAFALRPVGTYTSIGVIPFNSANKSGAMAVLSGLLSPEAQAGQIGTGWMTVYSKDAPIEAFEYMKKAKVHRSAVKYSAFVECVGDEFDDELKEIVISIWKSMVLGK